MTRIVRFFLTALLVSCVVCSSDKQLFIGGLCSELVTEIIEYLCPNEQFCAFARTNQVHRTLIKHWEQRSLRGMKHYLFKVPIADWSRHDLVNIRQLHRNLKLSQQLIHKLPSLIAHCVPQINAIFQSPISSDLMVQRTHATNTVFELLNYQPNEIDMSAVDSIEVYRLVILSQSILLSMIDSESVLRYLLDIFLVSQDTPLRVRQIMCHKPRTVLSVFKYMYQQTLQTYLANFGVRYEPDVLHEHYGIFERLNKQGVVLWHATFLNHLEFDDYQELFTIYALLNECFHCDEIKKCDRNALFLKTVLHDRYYQANKHNKISQHFTFFGYENFVSDVVLCLHERWRFAELESIFGKLEQLDPYDKLRIVKAKLM